MAIVDPVHNLFLGSAKHFLKDIWIDKGIIPESSFDVIQQKVDSIRIPTGMGRIPHKKDFLHLQQISGRTGCLLLPSFHTRHDHWRRFGVLATFCVSVSSTLL